MSSSPAPAPHARWGTIAQAAERYSVSPWTIRRMVSRGEVYAERIGPRLIRVDLDSFQTRPVRAESASA